jgi:Predicted amidophosphoribosyltransferases
VEDAFEFDSPEILEGKSILLLDDIYDSGATMNEIAKMLKEKRCCNHNPGSYR